MPAPAIILAVLALLLSVLPSEARREIRRLKKSGHGDVAYAYKNAAPEYREAIPRAYHEADPEGLHPEWERELWRICKRESWCGRWGTPKIHPKDAWAGKSSYLNAVSRGRLHPNDCPAHRVGEEYGQSYASFSTRGGFGQIAAGNLHRLGECVGPDALDDPFNGARSTLDLFAHCKKWDGPRGGRYLRFCSCTEHARVWMGAGKWNRKTELQRWRSTKRQCGADAPPLNPWSYVSHGVIMTARWAMYWAPRLAGFGHV